MGKITKWAAAFRGDGWTNILTSLGIRDKDKRTANEVYATFLEQNELEEFYNGDDVAARIVDRPPEEMTREGFEIFSEGEDDLTEKMQTYFEEHGLDKKIEEALKWARLYGGAGIIVGVNDGRAPDQPVDMNNIKSIDYVTVLDRFRLLPWGSDEIETDVTSLNFGKPRFYKLQNVTMNVSTNGAGIPVEGSQVKIHYSRVIRVEGVPVAWNLRSKLNWWGDSILSKLKNPIGNYQTTHDSTAVIIHDFTQLIVKLKGLADMMASGDDELVQKRLALVAATGSIINALVIEDGEEIERKSTNVSGLPELIKAVNARLVAATDLPHTVLLGEAAGGLGSTGESEKRDWYDHIKNKQEAELRPILTPLLKFIFAAKQGPTGGKVPEKFTVEFCPLWQPSEKEQAETRKIVAETDKIYLDGQVLDPDEVAESRFGSGQWSAETRLDPAIRKLMKEARQAGYENAANAGEGSAAGAGEPDPNAPPAKENPKPPVEE